MCSTPSFATDIKTIFNAVIFGPIAVLQCDSKCSRTNVYAPFLNHIPPCYRTKSKSLENSLGYFLFHIFANKLQTGDRNHV